MPSPFPAWTLLPPHVTFLFSEPKVAMVTAEIKSRFNQFRAENESEVFFFTDGSKSEEAVEAAYFGESQKTFRLHQDTSIFSAELFAILQVLRRIKHTTIVSSVI